VGQSYFHELTKKSKTRFWINNPTAVDAVKGLDNEAFACTTNPAYCSKLIASDRDYIDTVIDEVTDHICDYDEAATAVYRICVKRIMDIFMPLYEAFNGTRGFVTMQDDPRRDADTACIVKGILEGTKLSPNYMAKIPVIDGGIQAIEECVRHNIPICATEVFSISQALLTAQRYEAMCKETGNCPPIFITHISGIFDEYLGKYRDRMHIEIAPEVLNKAGIAIARKQYKLLREKYCNVTVLGGGARDSHHFTGIVGGPHITINWSTAMDIMDNDYPVEDLVDEEIPAAVIEELRHKFPDFTRAYDENSMVLKEFADYGPVQLFRNSFLNGWYLLLAEIARRKNMLAK